MPPDWKLLYLYGGDNPWDSSLWTDSDDRVRGGKSQSHLHCESPEKAEFFGDLDITALGGAGFASQRTLGTLELDLSQYDGLVVKVLKSDSKKYTLTIKDELLPPREDGRDQSTISWEFDFVPEAGEVKIPWEHFKPTYRGRDKPDVKPLDVTNIKRISFMMRSFFGTQAGDFSLTVAYLGAFSNRPVSSDSDISFQKEHLAPSATAKVSSWLGWICGWERRP
ncbi:complex I intermediate-associated protein 30 [Colletotrichum orchidophilum]|uniref:Complex I intermediate-associated protein 30 n=1 Tax=Colletotrichum orchidophilum TaxID=1209926 RepID=A0A1G4AZP8_9PEZI|nr:complex I intermediate-associated protein 30 [Colletotrichum orchidophilum]OHE94522.1 complex I intermediate-associated protein 30 [Colletotrichum orchidophilum]